MTPKNKIMKEFDFEFGVDSRYKNQMEKHSDSTALMQVRLERMKNLTKEQILGAKLLQLKMRAKIEK